MSDVHPPRRPGRSFGAVFAGLVAVFVLSLGTDALLHVIGIFPPLGQAMTDQLFVLATAYRTVYGVVGGYVTARLAPDRPMRHALIGGVVGLVLGTNWRGGDLEPRSLPRASLVPARDHR